MHEPSPGREKNGQRAIEELRFLAEASAILVESLDYESTLQAVAGLAVPKFADWCAVDILDDEGVLEPMALAHTNPESIRLADQFWKSYPRNMEDRHGMPQVVRTGQPEIYGDIIEDLLVPRGVAEEHINIVCGLGFRSVVLVPLIARGKTFGGMSFVASAPGRYDEQDVRFFDILAKRAALAVDNARLYTAGQLEIQRRMEIEAELERRVEARTAELRSAYRQLESFSYSVSHDLRSPLRSINLAAAVLLEEYGDAIGDSGRAEIHRAVTASKHMDRLIGDLLKHARLGTTPINRTIVDVSEMALLVADELDRLGVSVEVQPGLTAEVDPVLLRVLLQNLMENAIKFTRGHEEACLWIGQTAEGAFFVKDNGLGFDSSAASKLFEPFERLHSNLHVDGTGIGLSNVKRIVERHGGKVWAESRPGEGATFFFTLEPGGSVEI